MEFDPLNYAWANCQWGCIGVIVSTFTVTFLSPTKLFPIAVMAWIANIIIITIVGRTVIYGAIEVGYVPIGNPVYSLRGLVVAVLPLISTAFGLFIFTMSPIRIRE